MLLNASIVEPGYEGPLSCFLVNFSAHRVALRPDGPIAKVVFHSLTQSPVKPQPQVISPLQYRQELAEHAKLYHRSFLDVAGIEERAAAQAEKKVRGWVIGSGVGLGLLLLWATLEPVVSKWLWEKPGIISTTQRVEDARLLKDLEAAKESVRLLLDRQKQDEMKVELERLRAEVAALKKRAAASGTR
jgi:hypothetical protein